MQICVHLVLYAYEFIPVLKEFLDTRQITFIDYVYAVARGEVWADEFMIVTISHMWNVTISIISPGYSSEWNVFHKCSMAHIYIIGNG